MMLVSFLVSNFHFTGSVLLTLGIVRRNQGQESVNAWILFSVYYC